MFCDGHNLRRRSFLKLEGVENPSGSFIFRWQRKLEQILFFLISNLESLLRLKVWDTGNNCLLYPELQLSSGSASPINVPLTKQ